MFSAVTFLSVPEGAGEVLCGNLGAKIAGLGAGKSRRLMGFLRKKPCGMPHGERKMKIILVLLTTVFVVCSKFPKCYVLIV